MAEYDGFNDWFVSMLDSGWQGIEALGTDILDFIGFGTTRRAQEHDKEMLEIQNEFNAEQADINRDMQKNAYQIAVKDLESAGLNPNMVYGSGSTPTPAASGSSASAGSGGRASIQGSMNLIGQISGLMNSVTNARALDHQINRKSENKTTQSIYNSVGKLLKVIVTRSVK